MIVSKEIFRIKPNNKKWKTGWIQFKKRVGDYLDWQDRKEVMIIVLEVDENPTAEQLKEKLDEYKKMEEVFRDDTDNTESDKKLPKQEGHGNWNDLV